MVNLGLINYEVKGKGDLIEAYKKVRKEIENLEDIVDLEKYQIAYDISSINIYAGESIHWVINIILSGGIGKLGVFNRSGVIELQG